MTIKEQLNAMTTSDIYSLMMFVLFKLKDEEEYSTLSQLSYILDKENLLKLCEFYGGLTIHIPTIEELEIVLDALLLYQAVKLQHKDFSKTLSKFNVDAIQYKKICSCYEIVVDLLSNYKFNSGRQNGI